MAIRWDPLLAAATARTLSDLLAGAHVRALFFDAETRTVLLHLDGQTVAVELHPSRGHLSILPPTAPLPDSPKLSGRVSAVRFIPDDSIISLAIAGRGGSFELVFEMIGNRWNALLIDSGTGRIRTVLKPRTRGRRRLAVGEVYASPAQTGRLGLDEPLEAHEWEEIAAAGGTALAERKRALLTRVAWTSSVNIDALLGADGWTRWREMIDPSRWGSYVVAGVRGEMPYPVPLEWLDPKPVPSLLDAFRIARENSHEVGAATALLVPSHLLTRGDRRIRRARARYDALRRELEALGDPSALRGIGDLILARYRQIPRGESLVTLPGFDGIAVSLELDPTLSPQENAARLYAEAARIDRARASLPRKIGAAEGELAKWSALVESIRAGDAPWKALHEALGPPPGKKLRGPTRQEVALPYRRYSSSSGLEIRVGRGARENDELTFHHSAPDDIWLHARQAPGAHVILRWGRAEGPPGRDILEAATLAALHSDARRSASVPVVWTRRKHVRKPRKSPPGSVLPERVETLMVEPDPTLAERLEGESAGR